MKISKRIILTLVSKFTFRKNLFIFRPTQTRIARSAKIHITEKFCFNRPWIFLQKNHIGTLMIGENTNVEIGDFSFHNGCYLNIADNAYFSAKSGFANSHTQVYCKKSISIGEHVFIAENVVIRDGDAHHLIGSDRYAPVIIGDDVWIGTNAIILKGITIGDGAVIAAGSVVTHSVPPKCLVAGVPAKVIRENVEWEE